MDITIIRKNLRKLFLEFSGKEAENVIELPLSGSSRRYFRINAGEQVVIGTFNEDTTENEAFLYLADHFRIAGVNVPEVYKVDLEKFIYLQEDLGDDGLFRIISETEIDSNQKKDLYKRVIDNMPSLQVEAANGLDFTKCFPREAFDRQSIQWDLHYFKNMFLKLSYIPFHEQKLEDEFTALTDFLLEAPSDYFLFRDFQSRNIMFKDDTPFFIDFQGGRKGALQYDLASLLFDSKAALTNEMRIDLLNHYLDVFDKYEFFSRENFLKYYPAFILVRLFQAFGAYGYRGLYEKKVIFAQSIVKGLENLKWLSSQPEINTRFPYLCEVIDSMQLLREKYYHPEFEEGLTISITSFSYKKGLPDDWSGNGGGFIFDCRALPNPGRFEQYRSSTGRDSAVIKFFSEKQEMAEFINKTSSIISDSIHNYLERGFKHLSVSFGCTGGQHRSVFSAEQIFRNLKLNFDVNIRLLHRELNIRDKHVKVNVQKE